MYLKIPFHTLVLPKKLNVLQGRTIRNIGVNKDLLYFAY